jgi:hypothetical protein
MRKLIETIEGNGTVTSSSCEHAAVHYVLHIYQDQISVGHMQDANATIPGMMNIEGPVLPVCFFGDPDLTLELQDRRKLKFFFTDMHGSIGARSGLIAE